MKTPAAIYATGLYTANASINKLGQPGKLYNNKLEALINNFSEPIWIVSSDMQLIRANKSFAKSVMQAIGRTDQINHC